MSGKTTKFSEKYGPDAKPDPAIKEQIEKEAKEGRLPCAVAFKIADDMGVAPSEVGKTADLMEYRMVKCQLGLFGYQPKSAIVQAKVPENPDIEDAIKAGLVNDRLPCKTAWEIAARFDVRKMTVSAACEALKVKIKPCQLGAF